VCNSAAEKDTADDDDFVVETKKPPRNTLENFVGYSAL
jgi:hypothetical protein